MLMCQPDTWAPLKDPGSDSLCLTRDLGLCIYNKLPGIAMRPVHGPQLEQRGSSIQMVCQYLPIETFAEKIASFCFKMLESKSTTDELIIGKLSKTHIIIVCLASAG